MISIILGIIQGAISIAPEIVADYEKYKAGEITAEQVTSNAGASFSKLVATLIDPEADAAKENAKVDAEAAAKFAADAAESQR